MGLWGAGPPLPRLAPEACLLPGGDTPMQWLLASRVHYLLDDGAPPCASAASARLHLATLSVCLSVCGGAGVTWGLWPEVAHPMRSLRVPGWGLAKAPRAGKTNPHPDYGLVPLRTDGCPPPGSRIVMSHELTVWALRCWRAAVG